MAYKIKKDPIDKIPKAQFIFWIIVRVSLIACIIYSIVEGDYIMMGESIACFLFSHLWDFFQVFGAQSFIIEVPPLSQTMLNVIIFAGIPFGSYIGLFDKIWWYDIFMHIMTGIVCAVFGYDFAFILQRKKGKCSIILASMFALMFAMSIACGWEIYEFLMDYLHGTNLQLSSQGAETAMFDMAKYRNEYGYLGLVDTMTDMMMNTIGGLIGMIFMIILRNKNKKNGEH
jgi:uncharacterized membrane protein YjdF